MTVPGQILVRQDSSYWNADGESVITFGTYEYGDDDDDFSLSFDVVTDSDYSRWEEPNEIVGNNSPRFPQRKGSMVLLSGVAADLPKIPRRRQSVIVASTGSTSMASKLSFAQEEGEAVFGPQNQVQLPAMAQRQLPHKARGIAPPRFPCRKRSTGVDPSPSSSDICQQYPNRKCPNKKSAKAA